MNARTHILQRLRAAQSRARLPRGDEVPALTAASVSSGECLARFVVEATALGVDCHVENSADTVRRRLLSLVEGQRVLSWNREQLPYEASQAFVTTVFGDAPRADQAAAEVGVTGCDAAVAETGSVLFFSAPGRSRIVSLLPATHVAIVERRQLYFSMAEALAAHRHRFSEWSSCTVVTGPSRTADIELTLTLGIHGPARVVVIIGP